MRRFIVVGMQRSGTTVTASQLKRHPQVSASSDEVFVSPMFTQGTSAMTAGGEGYLERKAGYLGLFDTLTRSYANSATRACGLKVALNSYEDAIDFANCLREFLPEVAVIMVHRTDLVAQYASLVRAEATAQWHAVPGDLEATDETLRLDPSDFERYATTCHRATAQLRMLEATHDLFEISYEHDIEGGAGFDGMFRFLGLQPPESHRDSMRKVSPPPREYVENYDELRELAAQLQLPSHEEEQAVAQRRARDRAKDEHPSYLLDRALHQLAHGDRREAGLDALAAAVSRRPASRPPKLLGSIHAVLAACLESFDDPDLAKEQMTRLQDNYSGEPNFALARAAHWLAWGDHDEAADIVCALLPETTPATVERTGRSRCSARAWSRNAERAEADLDKLEPVFEKDPCYLIHRAWHRATCDRAEDAALDLRAAMAQDGDDLLDPELAAKTQGLLEHFGENGTPPPTAVISRSASSARVCRLRLGRSQLAVDDILALLERRGGVDSGLQSAAFEILEGAWANLGDIADAESTLDSLEVDYGDSAPYQLLRGIVLCHADKRDAGRDALQRASQLAPGEPRAGQLLREWFGD